MDTTYIKMCDCPEIQEQWDGSGDNYIYLTPLDAPPDKCLWLESELGKLWLPRQDQLQEMVNDRNVNIRVRWGDGSIKYLQLCNDYGEPVSVIYPTMEQLWLAFVMFELHQKKWNGEGWNVQT